jgi:hypothetical protein
VPIEVKTHEVVVDVHVLPPGDAVTRYPVTTEPPVFVGAVQFTVICVPELEPDSEVGAPGTVAGVRGPVATTEADPEPALFVAFTVNV